METKNIQEVNLKEFIKIVATTKKLTLTEVAKGTGVYPTSLSVILKKGDTKIKVLRSLLQACDEDLVIITKNGQKFKLTK